MNRHPGGIQHTKHLIDLSGLTPPSKLLDMGAGNGEGWGHHSAAYTPGPLPHVAQRRPLPDPGPAGGGSAVPHLPGIPPAAP